MGSEVPSSNELVESLNGSLVEVSQESGTVVDDSKSKESVVRALVEVSSGEQVETVVRDSV